MLSNKATRLKMRFGFFSAILLMGLGFYGCGSDSSFNATTLAAAAAAPIPVSVSAAPIIPVPVIPPSTAITGITAAVPGQVTISSPNTLASGDIVAISGSTNYDGTFTVLTATPPSFTVAAPFVGPLVSSGTTAPVVQPQILASPVTGVAPSTTPGQVTLVANNTLTTGAPIVISGSSIPELNGPNTVIAPTPTSFSITTTFVPPPPPPAGTPTPAGPTLGVILSGGGVLPGCTTTTTGAATAITLPSVATVPSRFTGVAPLAVFFDATSTTATATARPFHDLEYRWAFGESAGPGIGTWGTGSRPGVSSRNSATGPVAAHVFETPGTYIVRLTATDGTNTVSNSCVQIAVTDPDVVFAGANTICFSTSGTACSNPGAAQVTTSNFATAIAMAAPGKRLLFRRGESWTSSGGLGVPRLSANGPGIIGAFGTGNAPLVRSSAPPGNTVLAISGPTTPNITDWRIMDLEFDGLSGLNSNGVVGAGGAQQITFVRMNIHDISNGIQLNAQALDPLNLAAPGGHLLYDQFAIVDSNIQRIVGSGGNGMFLQARRLAVLGNFVDDTTAAEHVIRVQYASKGVFQANDFGLPAVTKHVLTLRAVNVGVGGVTSPNNTEQVVISDNLFRGGVASQPVSIQPSSGTEDQRISDIIMDGNLIRAGSSAQTGTVSAANEITLRNNIINMTGATAFNCITFQQLGAEPAHSEIRILNNTCFTNSAGGGALRLVLLGGNSNAPAPPPAAPAKCGQQNVTINNNLGFAPNLTGSSVLLFESSPCATTAGLVGGSGTFGNSSDAQIKLTSPLFANGSGTFSNASDFMLNAGSYAINAGVVVPVFTDLFRVLRPQGPAHDIGATEQ